MAEARSGGPKARPRSPHLGIYRWPITMGTSILHRVTGVGLAFGTLLVAWWLVAASMGPESYDTFARVAGHWFGQLVLFGFTVALIYHAVNGVRHLFWDVGRGFKMHTANTSGIVAYVVTVALTLLVWLVAYRSMGVI
ncbi:MAG: succinate dehydrogenase, cytochrome b556 subunit [Alphaproteobacteria bacterium]|nr:succinate dehydrogenase, cytochrome b556 subunit [Alphaproteobacteria bacterium]